jgi:phosphatidylinositol dimannoside acyltransferase
MSIDSLRWAAIDAVARALPRRAGYAVGGVVARLMYATDARGRAAVKANIRRIIAAGGREPSRRELGRLGRESYRNFAKYLMDFFRLGDLPREEITRLVHIEGEERLLAAVAEGRGVITLTAHLGNWEAAGAAVASTGLPLNAVFFPMQDDATRALFEKRRLARGYRPILFGRAAAQVMRLLRAGELVAMLGDIDFSPNDDFIDLFGAPARLPAGPARIALKTGAIIIPGFALRQPDNSYLFRYHEPIDPRVVGSVDGIRERIRDVLQEVLAAHPTQWMVFVDFWDHAETRRLGVEGVG